MKHIEKKISTIILIKFFDQIKMRKDTVCQNLKEVNI